MRTLALALTLVLAPICAAQSGAEALASPHGFRLTAPGPGWRVLDERAVRDLQPSAVAGLVHADRVFNVVVVEPLPDSPLTELARYWADHSGLNDARIDLFEELRYADAPAMRWMVRGSSEGIAWAQHFVIFVRDGQLVRLVSWARAEHAAADGSAFTPFLEALEFDPRSGNGSEDAPATGPEHGVGWMIANGIWKSSAYGMEIHPSGTWRFVIGDELLEWDPYASVGIANEASGARVTLTVERLDPADLESWTKELYSAAAAAGVERREAVLVPFSGSELELRMYDPRGTDDGTSLGRRTLWSHAHRGDASIRVRVDYPVRREGAALDQVRQLFEGLRLLDPTERAGVDKRVRAAFAETNLVGDGYSLRGGTYRDFRFGLSWTRPSTQWELELGEDAFARLPDAVLAMHNPYLGVRAAVIPAPTQALAPDELHDRVLSEMYADARFDRIGEARSYELGEVTATASESRLSVGYTPNQYRLLTTANDSWAFQIHFWGSPAALERASAAIEAAIAGFAIAQSPSDAIFVSGGALYDDRLGFQLLSPGPEWTLSDAGAENFWPAGTLAEWVRGEDECVGVVAVCGLAPDEEVDFLASLVRHGLPHDLGSFLQRDPSVREIYFCGQPVRELSWSDTQRAARAWTVYSESTMYLVYATDAAGELDELSVCDLFSLLP